MAWLHTFISAIPCVAFSTLAIYAIRVRTVLGHWPVVYRDNPSDIILKTIEYSFPIFYWLMVLAIYIWPVLLLLMLWKKRNRRLLYNVFLFIIPIALFVLANIYDRTGFFEWFWD